MVLIKRIFQGMLCIFFSGRGVDPQLIRDMSPKKFFDALLLPLPKKITFKYLCTNSQFLNDVNLES